MEVFPYSWHTYEESGCTGIRIFGLNKDNESVFILVNDFRPYVYIELPDNVPWTPHRIQLLSSRIDSICEKGKPINKSFQRRKKLYYANKEIDKDGNYNDKTYPFLKCFFKSKTDIRNFIYKTKKPIFVGDAGNISLKVHENDANPVLQFMCTNDIKPASWFTFLGKKITDDDSKESYCIHEYEASCKHFSPVENNTIVKPLIMAFDIEVNSSNPNVAPRPGQPDDKVFQISCVFCRNGDPDEKYEKFLLTLCKNKKGEIVEANQEKVGNEVEIRMFETESDLLTGFTEIITEKNPQIICGYNIFSFDLPYMYERSKHTATVGSFDQLSFMRGLHCEEKEINWSSSAYKNQHFKYLDAPGRLWVDMLPIIQRDYKMENYKLKTVSDFFLGETKDPLTHKGIFKCYRMFTPDALGVVGKYCVQDSNLVVKLFEKLQTWIGLCEMSNTCNTPIFALFTQGQQLKIFSQVYKKCMYDGIVIDKDSFIVNENDNYTGAYVFPPTPGIYDMVVSFDFSSLYPSTIIAYNIDYSTLVIDETIPDDKCHIFEWQDHVGCCIAEGTLLTIEENQIPIELAKNYVGKYVLSFNEEKSFVCYNKLKRFYDKGYKPCIKLIFEEKIEIICTPDHKIFDYISREWKEAQYVQMVCVNIGMQSKSLRLLYIENIGLKKVYDIEVENVHNFFANRILVHNCHDETVRKTKPKNIICASHKFRFLKEPPGVIPTLLRNLLDARKKTNNDIKKLKADLPLLSSQQKSDAERLITVLDKRQLSYKVSANSVAPNTAIPCIDENGFFRYLTIEEISQNIWLTDDNNNQVSKPKNGLMVWTEKGYTPIKYVIRHPIKNKLKRVLTHTGCVDVTDEHSLLNDKGNEVRTIDVNINDRLMHCQLPLPKDTPESPLFLSINDKNIEEFKLNYNGKYITSELAFVWGLFFAEGTCGSYDILDKAKSSWIIYNQDIKLLERAKILLENNEGINFSISNFYTSSNVYHLIPKNNEKGEIKKLADKYRNIFYDIRGSKRIPDVIFNSEFYIRQSFFMGYYAGDGNRFLEKGVVIQNKGEIGTAGLCYLAKTLGYLVSISYNIDKKYVYRLQCCTNFRNKKTTSIKSIENSPDFLPIKTLKPDIIRNNSKIFFNEEGYVLYRGIKIYCERIPRQKLLDTLDKVIDYVKIRNWNILEYSTKTKKIKYQKWCCGKSEYIGIRYLNIQQNFINICNCLKVKDNGFNDIKENLQEENIEYIYDIETENHHFAAGVGDLIVHNSMYGGMGVKRGYLPFLPGAMCTTARGRQSIEKAAKFLIENYGAKLIYGDSVSGDTPILVRYEDKTVDILRIDEMGEVWNEYEVFKKEDSNRKEKEQTLPYISTGDFRIMNILEVWTGEEWSKVKRVIRHKTVKKMFRILTHTGCVDVTEDHSLLDTNLQKIKPTEVVIGSELYHSFPPHNDFLEVEFKASVVEGKVYECKSCKEYKLYVEFYENYKESCKECVYKKNHQKERKTFNKEYISESDYMRDPVKNLCEDLAFVWGFFMAEGSCGKYAAGNGRGYKYSWALNNKNIELLEKCKKILEKYEPLFGWKILDTLESSSVYKLVPAGHVQYIVNKWRRLFYDREGYKKVPYFILNSSDSIKTQFFLGYYDGDGDMHTFNKINQFKFDIKGKIGAHGLFTLLYSLGYNVGLNTHKDNIYTLHTCKNFRNNPVSIKKIINIPDTTDSEYVYDIETESGRFLGGVGQIVLKNTDSTYLSFPQYSDLKNAKDLDSFCREIEAEVSSLFPKPMKLAYEEQIYWRYLILTKKRYMGLKCELDGTIDSKIAKRGVLLSRRDNSKFIREFYSKVIMKSFYKEPLDTVLYLLTEELNKLSANSITYKDLTISKSVGDIKDYKIRPLPEDDKKCEKRLIELEIFDKDTDLKMVRKIFAEYINKNEDFNDFLLSNPLEYQIVKEYVNKALPSQVQLAEKMRSRGSRVDAGERLAYVVTESGGIKGKLFQKIEDAEYFKEHSGVLQIDPLYYIKLLINPIDEVLSAVYGTKDIFKNYYKARENYYKVVQSIKQIFSPKIKLIE